VSDKTCFKCKTEVESQAYSCPACGHGFGPPLRALKVRLFVDALESEGPFRYGHKEGKAQVSFAGGRYSFLADGPGGGATGDFDNREDFVEFLHDEGMVYLSDQILTFSGRGRQCQFGLAALGEDNFERARERFRFALDLGCREARVGMALLAGMLGRLEEGREALNQMYSIFEHPKGPQPSSTGPANEFFYLAGGCRGFASRGKELGPSEEAYRQLVNWWTLLLGLEHSRPGEAHFRRGVAHQGHEAMEAAAADLRAAIPLLTEESRQVSATVAPTGRYNKWSEVLDSMVKEAGSRLEESKLHPFTGAGS
jgi:hypothetical protein